MDEVERRLLAANPLPHHRGGPLSPGAGRLLASTLAEHVSRRPHRVPRQSRRSWARRSILLAAATVVMLFVVAFVLVFRAPASVASPPLLAVTPVSGSSEEILLGLAELAAARGTESHAGEQRIELKGWYGATLVSGGTVQQFVQPEESRYTWNPADRSGMHEIRYLEVTDGTPTAENPAQPVTGAVLTTVFGPGEYGVMFATPPPADAAEFTAYLGTGGIPPDAATPQVFNAVAQLSNEWELDGVQTAAILRHLLELPEVYVLGEVEDRLERRGIAVATDSSQEGAFRDLLIFSTEDGALLSSERIYLGGMPELGLAEPSVVTYTAWKE